ncbi:MAG: chitinase [Clostridiales bacterium]|nr:chitinase [Clostridiales bacterium]
MKHAVIGYATSKGVAMMTKEDANRLTHVNLAFGTIQDGLLYTGTLQSLSELDRLRSYNPKLRIVLSVGGWGAGGFSIMAKSRASRKAFVDSVRDTMDRHRLDGVDIDWEYPCSGAADIDFSADDRENFTHLMRELRDMAGDRIVSIAAGAGDYFTRDTQMDLVAEACDYVQLMTYDMRSGFSRQAGHHTALDAGPDDPDGMTVKRAVQLFRNAGVPDSKLVIGAAFYSRRWEGVPNKNNGLLQPAQTVGLFGPGYTELANNYIGKNGWHAFWDENAQAPYLYNGSELISYDDPASIAAKCKYLREQGLLGIMYWEHSCDPSRALLTAMHEAMA